MKKFWVILGALVVAGVSAYAGGLADAITETVPVIAEPVEADSSVPGWVIPAAIIAVLIGVAVLADDDDDEDDS
ncbi:hypothetical protein BC777_0447 [Yoonia maricola]|uniref:Uncharacterized protein n=1 Tax=Yoonia maricola TaxID=420999 RepID=A0A2M8WL07_9RHOB|nr:hypothetical protein [Yoonia maricola]PJI91615.1 hypothetical protein BC777_0447 [Yoonia maricola]